MRLFTNKYRSIGFSAKLLFSFMVVIILAGFSGCWDKDDDDGPIYSISLLKGTHFEGIFARESSGSTLWDQIADTVFDGQGGYNWSIVYDSTGDTGNFPGTYTIAGNGDMTFVGTDVYGIVSSDGTRTAFTDTASKGYDNAIYLGASVEKSSGMTTSDLSGNFIFCQIRHDGARTKTAWFEMFFDGAGNINGTQKDDTDEGTTPISLNGTYSVASDGALSFTVDEKPAKIFQAHVSKDGNLVVILDKEADGEVLLMAGLKKTSGAGVSLLNGNYQLNMMSGSASDTNWTSRINATFDGNGNLTSNVIADSDGDTGTYNMTYTIATNGAMSVVETGDRGIVSSDGRMFIVVNTDTEDGDGDVMLGIGIKRE